MTGKAMRPIDASTLGADPSRDWAASKALAESIGAQAATLQLTIEQCLADCREMAGWAAKERGRRHKAEAASEKAAADAEGLRAALAEMVEQRERLEEVYQFLLNARWCLDCGDMLAAVYEYVELAAGIVHDIMPKCPATVADPNRPIGDHNCRHRVDREMAQIRYE